MSESIISVFEMIDIMIKNAKIDYYALQESEIDNVFFEDYNNTRIVNSFLFNFSKLQDKIGAKLFKTVLYELKEVDSYSLTMIDVLHKLEALEILDTTESWDRLREIRNILAHEYPFDVEERIENIGLSMEGFVMLEEIYDRLKSKIEQMKL